MKYTRHVYYLDNFEIACLKSDSIDFWNIDREHVEKEPVEVKWDNQAAEKSGYEHFMIKEIHEQQCLCQGWTDRPFGDRADR